MVSIIIPLYNAELYIEATIQSVIEQTYIDWELIIINDGSTDNSIEKVNSFVSEDSRIRLYTIANSGVSFARNYGLSKAKGEYVQFLDSDDILSRNFILNKSKFFVKYEVIGSIIHVFRDRINNVMYTKKSITEDIVENVLGYNKMYISCPSSYIFKKSFLVQNTLKFNPSLSSIADREFLLQLNNFNPKTTLDTNVECGLFYRISDTSMSNLLNKKLIDDNALFYELISNKYDKKYLLIGYKILYFSYFKIKMIRQGLFYFFRYITIFYAIK